MELVFWSIMTCSAMGWRWYMINICIYAAHHLQAGNVHLCLFTYTYRSIMTLLQVIVHFCTSCRIHTRRWGSPLLYVIREHQLSVVIHAWCPKAGFGIQHYAATVNLGFRYWSSRSYAKQHQWGPGCPPGSLRTPTELQQVGVRWVSTFGARPPQKWYLRIFGENLLKISG